MVLSRCLEWCLIKNPVWPGVSEEVEEGRSPLRGMLHALLPFTVRGVAVICKARLQP